MFARKNRDGEPVKGAYGPWMRHAFGLLARLKGLRGTAFDPFGYSEERTQERTLILEYRRCIEELLPNLSVQNLDLALEIARIPEEIRGYGHVKARNAAAAKTKWGHLMAQWRDQESQPQSRKSKVAA
jgi:indolepyruvate ferredoxin oxidoreductase